MKRKRKKMEEPRSSQGIELWIFVWKLTLIMELDVSMELQGFV